MQRMLDIKFSWHMKLAWQCLMKNSPLVSFIYCIEKLTKGNCTNCGIKWPDLKGHDTAVCVLTLSGNND